MRLFAAAALGAVLVAGCAPFEHGHYTTDVSYRNTTGDRPGTPLVYQENIGSRAVYDPSAFTAISSASPSYGAGQYGYTAPVSYGGGTTTAFVQPASQSVYSPAPVTNYTSVATTYGGQHVDADGYLVCPVGWPAHGRHETPHF